MSVCDGGADADGAGDDFAIIGFDEATSAAEVSGAVENDYLDVSLYQVTSSFRQSGKPQALSTAPPKPCGRCGAPGCGNSASRWCGKCGGQRCRKCCTERPTLLSALSFTKDKKVFFAMGVDTSWCLPCASTETARLIAQRAEQGPGTARVWTSIFQSRRLAHRQHQSHGGRVLIFRQRLAQSFEDHRNPKRRGKSKGSGGGSGGAGQAAAAAAAAAAAGAAPPDKKRSVSSLMLGEDWSSVNLISNAESAAVAACPAPTCGQEFGLLRRRHHCRLCGNVFCDACVFRSIQLYIDETGKAVVRLVAAGQQPMGAVLLRGCAACCDALERAMDLEARGGKPEPLPEPNLDDQALAKSCQELSMQRQQILAKLPAFRAAVLTMTEAENGGGGGGGSASSAAGSAMPPPTRQGSSSSISSTTSTATSVAAAPSPSSSAGGVQLVSLHMADISTLLAEFNTGMQLLKRRHLKAHPASSVPAARGGKSSRQRVAASVAQSMLAFYRDHNVEFRGLTEDLEQAIPASVLERIARGHDVRAVTNVLVILQLCVTESMAFKGLAPIHQRLANHVCKIEGSLEQLVTNYGFCSWPEHKAIVQGLVRELAREKPQIRQYFGNPNWEDLVRQKLCRNIESMHSQLEVKGTRDQFLEIAATLQAMEKDINTTLEPIGNDWEML